MSSELFLLRGRRNSATFGIVWRRHPEIGLILLSRLYSSYLLLFFSTCLPDFSALTPSGRSLQLEKKDVLMKEELRARDSEILELKRHVSEIVFERDTIQGEVASVGHQLDDARAESNKYRDLHTELVAVLSKVRAEA